MLDNVIILKMEVYNRDLDGVKSKGKILFTHWDGGRGHINRIIDIAKESKIRGYRIGLITTAAIKNSFSSSIFDSVYSIPTRPRVQSPLSYKLPLYSHARSHGQRQRGLGFCKDFILGVNRLEELAIGKFNPDVIVNDYRDTIKNITDRLSIPLVSIVQSNGHVNGQRLGWFLDVDDTNIPSCLNEFNEARYELGLSELFDERDLFMGDIQIVPSIPEIDPVNDELSSTWHVGLLSSLKSMPDGGDCIDVDSLADNYIVCNIAAINRQRYGQDILLKKVPQELDLDVISTGESIGNTETIQRRLGRYIARQYINYDQVLPHCGAFVSYGGHGSTLKALTYGVPIVGLGAFSSEQRGTLENICNYGAGIVIPHGSQLESIVAPDMDNMNIYGNWSTTITHEKTVEAIEEVLHDSYAVQAMKLAIKLRQCGGSVKVVNLIEQRFA